MNNQIRALTVIGDYSPQQRAWMKAIGESMFERAFERHLKSLISDAPMRAEAIPETGESTNRKESA
jgi:hypothetical protein